MSKIYKSWGERQEILRSGTFGCTPVAPISTALRIWVAHSTLRPGEDKGPWTQLVLIQIRESLNADQISHMYLTSYTKAYCP